MSVTRQVALAFGILIVAGCSMLDPNGTLDGSVFIVTKGHESVKLGLVQVVIIAEKDFAAFLEKIKPETDKLRSEAETRYQLSLKYKTEIFLEDFDSDPLNRANYALDQAKTIYHRADDDFKKAKAAFDLAQSKSEDTIQAQSNAYEQAKVELGQAKAKADLAGDNLKIAQAAFVFAKSNADDKTDLDHDSEQVKAKLRSS